MQSLATSRSPSGALLQDVGDVDEGRGADEDASGPVPFQPPPATHRRGDRDT